MRSDAEREQLKQYVPLLVGTRADAATEERRGWMATDWLVRTATPMWLRLVGLESHADALQRLKPLVSHEMADAATSAVAAARDAARDASKVTWDADMDDVWEAAGTAATNAANAAAAAAWTAGVNTFWTAQAAALTAALCAVSAREAVIHELQASAHDLFRRMIAAGSPS